MSEVVEQENILYEVAKKHCTGCNTRTGHCMTLSGDRKCNLMLGKRCSSFARVILRKRKDLQSLYDDLPMRGPDDE